MAFFGFGKKKEAKKQESLKVEAGSKKVAKAPNSKLQPSRSVLIRPRITEKTGNLTAMHVYTFDVQTNATKRSVASAIEAEYTVKPVAVRIVTRKAMRVRLRTRRGFGATNARKKAYVTVKKGDRIEFAS
jgi:large subunit ribosomal protein L23